MTKIERLRELLENHRDEVRSEKMAAYMKDNFKFYGIPSPDRKKITKDFIKEEKLSKVIDWDFLYQCYEEDERECHYIAIDILIAMRKHLTYEDIDKILPFIKNQQWWDTIDALDAVIGGIGLVDERVFDLMIQWSQDDDMWFRRLAIDFQLAYKDQTNTDVLETIILNNLGSTEFFINKAIGWSLREYSKVNPEWVKDFIRRHHGSMSPLSIREASKYI